MKYNCSNCCKQQNSQFYLLFRVMTYIAIVIFRQPLQASHLSCLTAVPKGRKLLVTNGLFKKKIPKKCQVILFSLFLNFTRNLLDTGDYYICLHPGNQGAICLTKLPKNYQSDESSSTRLSQSLEPRSSTNSAITHQILEIRL